MSALFLPPTPPPPLQVGSPLYTAMFRGLDAVRSRALFITRNRPTVTPGQMLAEATRSAFAPHAQAPPTPRPGDRRMSALDPQDWAPIAAAAARADGAGVGVRLSASRKDGRFRHRLVIAVRLAAFGAERPAWLAPGAPVSVALGRNAMAGTLRIIPMGPHSLRAAPRAGAALLRLPQFPGLPAEGAPATPCEYDWSADWLDITLPPWLAAAPPVAARTAQPPAAAKPEPFSLAPGVSSHPGWASPKGRAAHEAAIKRGAA